MGHKQVAIVEFQTKVARASVTRPANTTPYTAGDIIAAVTTNNHLTFSDVVEDSGGTGSIDGVRVTSSANQSTKPDLELWLFHTDITEVGDNVAFAPTDAEMLTRVGIIDLSVDNWKAGHSGSGATGNACIEVSNLGAIFNTATKDLIGVLVVRNGYTPVSSEIFTVELLITRD